MFGPLWHFFLPGHSLQPALGCGGPGAGAPPARSASPLSSWELTCDVNSGEQTAHTSASFPRSLGRRSDPRPARLGEGSAGRGLDISEPSGRGPLPASPRGAPGPRLLGTRKGDEADFQTEGVIVHPWVSPGKAQHENMVRRSREMPGLRRGPEQVGPEL